MIDSEAKEALEVEWVLETLLRVYGYDFRSYERDTLRKQLKEFTEKLDLQYLSELIPRLTWDRNVFDSLSRKFSVTVTSLFRNPHALRGMVEEVFPYLETHPQFRIWHAGCATGQEVYSLAILLKEAGLYNRATIFATDFNDAALKQAKLGVYKIDDAREASARYLEAGGKKTLSDYYTTRGNHLAFHPELQERITFANHNLVTDEVFSEVHLIVCRNVLIYFDESLRNRVLQLFHQSLFRSGFFWLGSGETLIGKHRLEQFDQVSFENRIYQKQLKNHPQKSPKQPENNYAAGLRKNS